MVIIKHSLKKWEVSMLKMEDEKGFTYKVTRRLPNMSVAETKVFSSLDEAKRQFDEWLE